MRRRQLLKSLWQPQLLMGCERMPWIIVAMCSGVIAMAASWWLIRVLGILFGIIVIFIRRSINKDEPLAFKIGIRYITHQKFYLNVARHPSRPYAVKNIDI